MRSVFLSSVIVAVFVILGCGGMTNDEKESLVATAVARAEAEVEVTLREAFQTQQDQITDRLLKQNDIIQATSDELYDRFNVEIGKFQQYLDDNTNFVTEANQESYDSIVGEVRTIGDRNHEAIVSIVDQNVVNLIWAICEAEYWSLSQWNAIERILEYLSGRDAALREAKEMLIEGASAAEAYHGDAPGVCGINESGEWYLPKAHGIVTIR